MIGGSIALLSLAAYKRKQQDKQEYNQRVEKVENGRREKREQRRREGDGGREETSSQRENSEHDTMGGSDHSSDATRHA